MDLDLTLRNLAPNENSLIGKNAKYEKWINANHDAFLGGIPKGINAKRFLDVIE